MEIIFKNSVQSPKVSIVLLDWSCRESFHILNYLANQPYKEVAPLINLLAKLTPYEDSNLETKTGDKGKSGK